MKKYKINRAVPVNKKASRNGVKWEYVGKATLEEAQSRINSFENSIEEFRKDIASGYIATIGYRVTDTETGEVIYEKMI